ncbi:helix-turn-helix domain-containing protein [Enterococcus sp. AZ103]|uniref:helix-turn-helix domain-containing protein n=1 Tax=Enterococcus sp. AZ103 TaxID=2774628 RepID=UPI003F281B6F
MKIMETKNKIIDAKPFQLFSHDYRIIDYQEELLDWSREHLKTEALFYQFQVKEEMVVTYLPDACVNLIFEIKGEEVTSKMLGILTEAKETIFEPGICYFGVKPYTNVGLRCKEKDQSCLVNQLVSLDSQFPAANELIQKFKLVKDFQQRKDLILADHRSIFLDENRRSVLSEYLSVLLCTNTTAISMEKVGDETGYSRRYTQQIFRREIGISPKKYSRIIRFQNAIKAVFAKTDMTLAKLACQLGYYDQAHLIHEFQLFTQQSPKNLMESVTLSK